jgi:hypothetical protein
MTDAIMGPTYPVLKIGKETIWDLTDLDRSNINELLSSDPILEPTRKDENHVIFCKGTFNIKALIFNKATANEILSGWTVARDELKLDRLETRCTIYI